MSNEETTAIATIESQYPVLAGDTEAAMTTLRENLGGEMLSPSDLDVIKVPSSGVTHWSVPTIEEPDGSPQKEIEGVIVYQKIVRAYWKQGLEKSGGGTPPDCKSDDNVHGIGDPGGLCAECPFSEWESDANGRGQACKQFRLLFLLRPGDTIPAIVRVPASSLNNAKKYLLRLAQANFHYGSVTTKLTLAKTKNAEGVEYSEIHFAKGQDLDPETFRKVQSYAELIRPALERISVDDAVESEAA